MQPSTVFGFRIPIELFEQLKALADKDGRTLSDFIRRNLQATVNRAAGKSKKSA